jgi:ferredoxin
MKVWIDQDLCTGDGLCEEICPDVFWLHSDGLAYVKEPEEATLDASGEPVRKSSNVDLGIVAVRADFEEKVQEASEECPGECIFIE